MIEEKPNPKKSSGREMKLLASISFQAGCLTVVAAGLALVGGLWLDARFGTVPRWTLIFVLGSVPITLGVIFWLTRRAVRSVKTKASHSDVMENDED
jgi:hypothetical protein